MVVLGFVGVVELIVVGKIRLNLAGLVEVVVVVVDREVIGMNLSLVSFDC